MNTTTTRLKHTEAMKVDLPYVDSEGVLVETFEITEREAEFSHLRAMLSGGRGRITAGEYTRLAVDGTLWMTDSPDEMWDHYVAYRQAQIYGGRCLIHGLGLGMVLQAMLLLDNVEHVDVVELDERIIRHVGEVYAERFPGRVTFHHGDAYEYRFPAGSRWTVAWHDIWPTISGDNWEGMNRLHRRYGGRVAWQGSWMRDEVKRLATTGAWR